MVTGTLRYHHGDLRAALVERATDVVAVGGVDALSMRELARDLGVSHAAPSRHFADRQALLDAVAVNGFDRLGVALDATPPPADASFEAQVGLHAACYVRFALRNAPLLAVMFAAKHRREAPAAIRDSAERAFAAPLQLLQRAQQRGEVVAGSIDEISTAILATMHGFATLVAGGLLAEQGWERSLAETMTLLVAGLRPRSSPRSSPRSTPPSTPQSTPHSTQQR